MSDHMDPHLCAQDVLRCNLCEIPVPPMYCDICHIHLCKSCVGEHFSDESAEHKVVLFRTSVSATKYPKCSKHLHKQCELHCAQCDIPTCVQCVSSGEHLGHKQVNIEEILETKKEILQIDLQELENSIYPKYQEIALDIPDQKAFLVESSKDFTTALNKHGELWYNEIDIIIKNLKSEFDEIESKHMNALNSQEDQITRIIDEVTQSIGCVKKLLVSNDISLVSEYKSTNAKFRKLPPKLTYSLPKFMPQRINSEHINELFGHLVAVSTNLEERSNTVDPSGAISSPPNKPLINEPRVIKDIDTDYGDSEGLYSVSCLSDDDVWTRGQDNIMRLYSLRGDLIKSIQTSSKKRPQDIAVTSDGELVYTDPKDRTVNIEKNTEIQAVITLEGWQPLGVCSTPSGDLLIVVNSDDRKQTKVVRYFGSTPKLSIQYNAKGQPLYSSFGIKYISENRNLDICVSDYTSSAVVVVNQDGQFRFKYTGTSSTTKGSFDPVGVATDSQSLILTADCGNHCIHIIDQDGQFLRFIDNCNLNYPYGLCMDNKDNLIVADNGSGKVKKIQYYM